MRAFVVALVLCSLLLAVSCTNSTNSAVNVIQPCTYVAPSGESYDFSPMIVNLTQNTKKSQLYTGTDLSGYSYYANICNVVSSDAGCPTTDQTPVCQLSSTGTQESSCGVVTAQSFQPASEPTPHPHPRTHGHCPLLLKRHHVADSAKTTLGLPTEEQQCGTPTANLALTASIPTAPAYSTSRVAQRPPWQCPVSLKTTAGMRYCMYLLSAQL